jgi:hypothetical protein
MNISDSGFLVLCGDEESSLRVGLFSRQSNLKALATSDSCKIASYLAMTILLIGGCQW